MLAKESNLVPYVLIYFVALTLSLTRLHAVGQTVTSSLALVGEYFTMASYLLLAQHLYLRTTVPHIGSGPLSLFSGVGPDVHLDVCSTMQQFGLSDYLPIPI